MKHFKYNKPSLEELCEFFKFDTINNYYVDGFTIKSKDTFYPETANHARYLSNCHKELMFRKYLAQKRVRISEVRISEGKYGSGVVVIHHTTDILVKFSEFQMKDVRTHKNTWYVFP